MAERSLDLPYSTRKIIASLIVLMRIRRNCYHLAKSDCSAICCRTSQTDAIEADNCANNEIFFKTIRSNERKILIDNLCTN